MDRVRPLLTLYVFGMLGAFLAAAPWTPIWERGTTYLVFTSLGGWVRSGWARGIATGLGVLDLIVALQEADRLRRALRARGGEPAA